MDLGLERLRNMVLDMAELSQNTVSTAIDAYVQGRDLRDRIYGWSEELRMLQDEVSELAIELIAGYLRPQVHQVLHGGSLRFLEIRKIRARHLRCSRHLRRPIQL